MVYVRFDTTAWLVLSSLMASCSPQCLTPLDQEREVSSLAHDELLRSELQFSTDLVRSLQPDRNMFLSPSSVYRALLMAYFISSNQTENDLKKALHLPAEQDKVDTLGAYTIENFYQKLRSISSKGVQWSIANRLYVAKKLKVRHCIKTLFSDEISPADFEFNHVGVIKKINQWISGQTKNNIKDFLSDDSIRKETQLVLVNAAYFKGNWKNEFPVEDTFDGEFYLSNGTVASVPMMTQEGKFRLRADKKMAVEMLELPYTEDVSMIILLPFKPSPSALQDVLKKMDAAALQNLVKTLSLKDTMKLQVTIPKFTVEESLELTPIFDTMGIGDLFKQTADLSTLTGSKGLYFSEALHKAKIRVDEKGTEAAAATAFIAARMGVDSFIADHPFIYILYHKSSHFMLFFGVFNSPQLS